MNVNSRSHSGTGILPVMFQKNFFTLYRTALKRKVILFSPILNRTGYLSNAGSVALKLNLEHVRPVFTILSYHVVG